MSEHEPVYEDDADDTMSADRQTVLAEIEDDGLIAVACAACSSRDFELIQIHGMNILLWNPIEPDSHENKLKQESKFAEFFGGRRVSAYRCRKCNYIMLFAG